MSEPNVTTQVVGINLPPVSAWSCSHCGGWFLTGDTIVADYYAGKDAIHANGHYHARCHPPRLTIEHAHAIRLMMEYVRTLGSHVGGFDWMEKADEASAIIEREAQPNVTRASGAREGVRE